MSQPTCRCIAALLSWGLVTGGTGCTTPAPEVPARACLTADDPDCAPSVRQGGGDADPSPVAYAPEAPEPGAGEDRWAPQRLAGSSAATTRPPRHGRHDVRLHQARLDDAVRLLAREGDFNVVIHGDLPQTVSVELRDVDAYEALLVLAESHGVAVHYADGIVTVKSPERVAEDEAP